MTSAPLFEDHPLHLVAQIAAKLSSDAQLEFARYRYTPQSLRDDRTVFRIPGRELTATWFYHALSSLAHEEELALQSRVLFANGNVQHLPLIDFAEGVTGVRMSDLGTILASCQIGELWLYESGRSFHGYGTSLIDGDAWTAFMGSLLLANSPSGPHLVDCRWIGHRLRAGYASLRWSSNSTHHRQLPRLSSTFGVRSGAP